MLLLRVLFVLSSLRAGAQGGLLTPSFAIGALQAIVLGELWNLFLPTQDLGAYALIGAATFLAAAQKMPLTAIALLFEFTHVPLSFIIPLLFSITGAMSIFTLAMNKYTPNNKQ